jgi:hypothetical protein
LFYGLSDSYQAQLTGYFLEKTTRLIKAASHNFKGRVRGGLNTRGGKKVLMDDADGNPKSGSGKRSTRRTDH